MSPAVAMTEINGRGRSIVSTRPLKAGEIILKDSPILLYSAHSFSTKSPNFYCSNCFKFINSHTHTFISCHSCSQFNQSTLFCSSNCHSIALKSSHAPWICDALRRVADPLVNHHRDNLELHLQARFLIAAVQLAVVSPESFATLLSLQGEVFDDDSVRFLYSLVSSISLPSESFKLSLELTAALLAKDKLNAFGLMEPFDESRERGVRCYGIYPKASFFNHDCLPNACRFEYVDSDRVGGDNTEMVIRVIHDLPLGREICLSYFPVNFKYGDRQKRLMEDYGFKCECDRCRVEANWSDDDDENEGEGGDDMDEEDAEEDEGMEDDQMEEGESSDQNNDFPHSYFFVKYMCNKDNCWGTLAPLPPSDSRSDLMECNVCGNLTKDSQAAIDES